MAHRIKYVLIVYAFIAFALAVGWSIAYATVEALPPQLIELPWVQMIIGMAIASWGGVTATLSRYMAAMYHGKPFHWKGEVVKDLFVSVLVGTGTYLFGWVQNLSAAALGLALLLAGFLGIRLLSFAADRFMKGFEGKA
jgi:hypothetical protein